MDNLIIICLFAVVAIASVIAIVVSVHLEKKRTQQFSQAATELGLTFLPEGSSTLFDRLSQFSLFQMGYNRQLKNLVQGDAGDVKLAIFDYQYTSGSGKNAHTYKSTIAVIESEAIQCPVFSLRPEHWFDKFGSMFGLQDIDFESHPNFSSQFVLQSPNEEGVRAFFKPKLLEYFETHPDLSVEAGSGIMFFYRGMNRIKPTQIKDLLAQAYETYGKIVDG